MFLETLENCSQALGIPTSLHLPTVSVTNNPSLSCLKNPFRSFQWRLSIFFYQISLSCSALSRCLIVQHLFIFYLTVFLHSLTRTQAPESTKARLCCRKTSRCPHVPGKAEGSPLVVLCHGYLNLHLPGWLQALNEAQKQRTEQEHGGRQECESMSSASKGFWPAALHRCILEHGDVQMPFWTGLL